jgi:hypothetical protein
MNARHQNAIRPCADGKRFDVKQHFRGFGLVAAMILGTLGNAQAQFNQSEDTDLDLDLCTVVHSDDFGSTWACNGHKGIPVMIAERDEHFMVSFGLTSTTEPAAKQTLPPVNHLGGKIEWRISNASGAYKPFAAIVPYLTEPPKPEEGKEPGAEGRILVVFKIEMGKTCQIAWIDAVANADAAELARKTADETAPDFDCAKEPAKVGKFEAWKP